MAAEYMVIEIGSSITAKRKEGGPRMLLPGEMIPVPVPPVIVRGPREDLGEIVAKLHSNVNANGTVANTIYPVQMEGDAFLVQFYFVPEIKWMRPYAA